jgi:hypothetical protein
MPASPTKKKRKPLKNRPKLLTRKQQITHGQLHVEGATPGASASLLLRARQQQALRLLSEGHTLDQIALELGTRIQEVQQDIAKASDRLVKLYACSPQHTFVRYAVFQLGIINKLQAAVERFEADKKTVQYNAVVSALRAQSDAYDRILEKGLSFGIIERKQASGAIRKPAADIRNMLKTEILTLSRLLDEVDLSIEFKTARARFTARQQEAALQRESTYAVIIRKPLVGPHGVIRAIPDWKYRRRTYTRLETSDSYSTSTANLDPATLQLHRLAQEIATATTSPTRTPASQPKRPQPPQPTAPSRAASTQPQAAPPFKGYLVQPTSARKPTGS